MENRKRSISMRTLTLAALAWAGASGISEAVLFDWNNQDWTARWNSNSASVSQQFNNVGNSGVNVTITVTRNPTGNPDTTQHSEVALSNTNAPNGLPDDVSGQFTGRGGNEALLVDVNWTSPDDYVEFQIQFSQPVGLVNFELWDIDLGNAVSGQTTSRYQDIIGNFTTTRNGVSTGVAPTFSALQTTGTIPVGNVSTDTRVVSGELHGVAAAGLTNALGNNNDGQRTGDVLFTYNGVPGSQQAIDTISFRYKPGNGSSAGISFPTNDPTLQRIALGDINFTPIPEVSTANGALFACAAVVMYPFLGRRRRSLTSLSA